MTKQYKPTEMVQRIQFIDLKTTLQRTYPPIQGVLNVFGS